MEALSVEGGLLCRIPILVATQVQRSGINLIIIRKGKRKRKRKIASTLNNTNFAELFPYILTKRII